MDVNTFLQSKILKRVLLALAVVAAVLLVLKAGILIGYQKASYSYRWGEFYHKNFGGPQPSNFVPGLDRTMMDQEYIGSHGTFGSVLSVDGNTVLLKGQDSIERSVLLSDDTTILEGRGRVSANDLEPGETMTVIGAPNGQGQITAEFIRVFNNQ